MPATITAAVGNSKPKRNRPPYSHCVIKDILLINATNSMATHRDTSLNPIQAHLIPKLIIPCQLNPLLLHNHTWDH